MGRPLLVGESNPYSVEEDMALYPLPSSASGARLCRIFGITPAAYLRKFSRVNLVAGKWSLPLARHRAAGLSARRRVLLGARVCQAHGVPFAPFRVGVRHSAFCGTYGRTPLTAVCSWSCFEYLVLPHPSGRCRVWNDAGAIPRARVGLRRLLGEEGAE